MVVLYYIFVLLPHHSLPSGIYVKLDNIMHDEEGPTFEDLQIDDTLNDLERVEKYSRSNIALQRYVDT